VTSGELKCIWVYELVGILVLMRIMERGVLVLSMKNVSVIGLSSGGSFWSRVVRTRVLGGLVYPSLRGEPC
jgi:hypothetical protein